MPSVSSSAILAIDYVPDFQILRVTFINGQIYSYLGVPDEVHQALMVAPSRGQYFNEHIFERYDVEHQPRS